MAPTANGRLAFHLALAVEDLPDHCHPVYAGKSWYEAMTARFLPLAGMAAALARWRIEPGGGNVRVWVLARLVERVRGVPAMESWVEAIESGASFCRACADPATGRGVERVEAARGALGHWIRVAGGRIRNDQAAAPTIWNFSPRDGRGRPGPPEPALEGVPVAADEPNQTPAVAHVVRSADPCRVCTVQ